MATAANMLNLAIHQATCDFWPIANDLAWMSARDKHWSYSAWLQMKAAGLGFNKGDGFHKQDWTNSFNGLPLKEYLLACSCAVLFEREIVIEERDEIIRQLAHDIQDGVLS